VSREDRDDRDDADAHRDERESRLELAEARGTSVDDAVNSRWVCAPETSELQTTTDREDHHQRRKHEPEDGHTGAECETKSDENSDDDSKRQDGVRDAREPAQAGARLKGHLAHFGSLIRHQPGGPSAGPVFRNDP
jgi:hypothetical protein